ncbi:hypothetical protein D3C78_1894910 [compost metagenome]
MCGECVPKHMYCLTIGEVWLHPAEHISNVLIIWAIQQASSLDFHLTNQLGRQRNCAAFTVLRLHER